MDILRVGPVLIALKQREVTVEGKAFPVTELEYAILLALAQRPNETLSPDAFLSAISPILSGPPPAPDAIVPQFSRLRSKMAELSRGAIQIRLVPGKGFRLEHKG
jgi:DNA-binding response OmpR family regulator